MSIVIRLKEEDWAFADGSQPGPVFKEVGFFRTSWDEVPEEILRSCAELYCNVWKEAPWNEDFWKPEEVLVDISKEMSRQGADCFIAFYVAGLGYCEYENKHNLSEKPIARTEEERTRVLGFTWGYPVDAKEMRDISGNNYLDRWFTLGKKMFYVDELAVKNDYRGQKIGSELSRLLIKSAKSQGFRKAILRTDKKAVAAKRLYVKMGFRDLEIEDSTYPNRTYWLLEL